jgi:hypothetical protein
VQKYAHTKKNNHINPSISPYKPVCAKNNADFRLHKHNKQLNTVGKLNANMMNSNKSKHTLNY